MASDDDEDVSPLNLTAAGMGLRRVERGSGKRREGSFQAIT